METRTCSKCKIEKTLDKFSKDKNSSTGYTYQCKDCRNSKYKEYYLANPDKIKQKNANNWLKRKEYYASEVGIASSRKAHLKRNYNITLEEYQQMSSKQNHKCAICNSTEMNVKNKVLCVDHNHTTGNIRALLCSSCNTGLGNFKDNIDLLQKAIQYIKIYDKQYE